jgi:O-antigen ligase
MYSFLILLFCLLYLILAIRKLDLALGLLVFLLPTYLLRFNLLTIPMTLLESMILLAFFVWFIKSFQPYKYSLKKFLQDQHRRPYPFRWEIVLWLLISFGAILVGGNTMSALGIFKAYFLEPVMLYILIINVFKRDAGFSKILWALGLSALAVSLVAIYQKITGQFIFNPFWSALETRRAVSVFGYPNAVALYLAPIIMLLFGWLAKKWQSLKTSRNIAQMALITIIILLALLAIYFAKSDGALIALISAFGFYLLFISRRARYVLLGLIVVLFFFLADFKNLRQDVVDKITLKDLSGQIRRSQWQETWVMLKDGRLIFGAGLANYQKAVAPYHHEGIFITNHDPDWLYKVRTDANYRQKAWQPLEIYLYPHNILLNFWSELGILGALLFVWLMVKYFCLGLKNLWWQIRHKNKNRYIVLGLLSAMVVIVVHGLVDVPYFKNDLSALFFIILAMMGIMDIYYQNQTNQKI